MAKYTEAFEAVKKRVTNFPIRCHLVQSLPTVLEIDASRLKGTGYVLMQAHKDGKTQLVKAESRWLAPAEQSYGMTSLELFAVNWAVEKCKPYLLGLQYFEILTDHQTVV